MIQKAWFEKHLSSFLNLSELPWLVKHRKVMSPDSIRSQFFFFFALIQNAGEG